MPLFARWRAERNLERKAQRYVSVLMGEPAAQEVAWLAGAATRDDEDHARWELRYAKRALGLLAAERDALDDRTASGVARALSGSMLADRLVASELMALAERQFNARLSAYRDSLSARSGPPPGVRLGQVLFAFAGASFRDADEDLMHGGEILSTYLVAANQALQDIFGAARLPENVRPSALLPR